MAMLIYLFVWLFNGDVPAAQSKLHVVQTGVYSNIKVFDSSFICQESRKCFLLYFVNAVGLCRTYIFLSYVS